MMLSNLLLSSSLLPLVHAWTTFVVPHSTDHSDDAAVLNAALANYTANVTILFKKGVTYNIFTPVTFPVLNNVEVSIQGNLTYPNNIATIQGKPTE